MSYLKVYPMATTFKVPIRNLFYLLSYANEMPEIVDSLNEVEDDVITFDFLAEQFHREVEMIMRRGLVRNYVSEVEETSSIGGRLMLTESLPYIMRRIPVVVCEKDEYAANVLLNQIMKATLESIHGNRLVKENIRMKSYRLWEQLPTVSSIQLQRRSFYEVNLHRHNMYYKRMIHLARLLFEFALLSHRRGDWALFSVDMDDRALGRLFEMFLLRFYERETSGYRVGSRRIPWKLSGIVTSESKGVSDGDYMGNEDLLPTMLTDVSLHAVDGKRAIIIDAKFYKDAFQVYENNKTFISNHMYQMFTYLHHQSQSFEQVRGILVYPYNGEHFNEVYKWDERITLQLMSVDLGAPWEDIKKTLLDLVA